jgi:endonuclease YncB( thermonuclease family)
MNLPSRTMIVTTAGLLLLMGMGPLLAQPAWREAHVIGVQDGDTIEVRLIDDAPDDPPRQVRYLAISTPDLEEPLREEARQCNHDLVAAKKVWLELNPQNGGYQKDQYGRLLAYVYLDAERKEMANLKVVEAGYARLDVRGAKDNMKEDDFAVRHVPRLIEAQIAAAKKRRGWWGQVDPDKESDLLIVAVKYWGRDEVAYLLNRGNEPIDLGAGWKLADAVWGKSGAKRRREPLDFRTKLAGQDGPLPRGGILRVHSGNEMPKPKGVFDRKELPWDFYWIGEQVWHNTRGDEAWLTDPAGKDVYHFQYPPRWVPQEEQPE